MKNIHILAILFTIILNHQVTAQNEIILVWKKEIPGEIKNDKYQEKEVYKNGELQSTFGGNFINSLRFKHL